MIFWLQLVITGALVLHSGWQIARWLKGRRAKARPAIRISTREERRARIAALLDANIQRSVIEDFDADEGIRGRR